MARYDLPRLIRNTKLFVVYHPSKFEAYFTFANLYTARFLVARLTFVGDVEPFCETFVQSNFLAIRVIGLNIHGSFVGSFTIFGIFLASIHV